MQLDVDVGPPTNVQYTVLSKNVQYLMSRHGVSIYWFACCTNCGTRKGDMNSM